MIGKLRERHDDSVALIKSLNTNNRFYALVSSEQGISNASVVEDIPFELLLGIAYPCIEDGLNDFAVIRTSYETMELFPDDEEMLRELREMIYDARGTLVRRLMELLERIIARKAFFLGTDLKEFKNCALDLMQRGIPRRNLDGVMKVNVFSSVAAGMKAEHEQISPRDREYYRYEFHNGDDTERIMHLSGRDFLVSLFADVLDSVLDDDNYESKYTFDKNIFQQFIALMFITYASTDPIFYGTHREDYGVSRDKKMDNTPLYKAVAHELRRISEVVPATSSESGALKSAGEPLDQEPLDQTERLVALPPMAAYEDRLLDPIAAICAVAQQLHKHSRGDTVELTRLILTNASHLVQELKRLDIISPLAFDPGAAGQTANFQEPVNDELNGSRTES